MTNVLLCILLRFFFTNAFVLTAKLSLVNFNTHTEYIMVSKMNSSYTENLYGYRGIESSCKS